MAKISVVQESIMLCRSAGVTPFIYGHRGLGKSSIIRQLAEKNKFGFIDLRCSQIEASDIRGLPDRVNGRTAYLPPADLPSADMTPEQIDIELAKAIDVPVSQLAEVVASWDEHSETDLVRRGKYAQRKLELQPHFERGILFLDEVNRAQDDVLQSIFELVLDHRVGLYNLPPGWSIVAAGNYMEGGYRVGGFDDAAFLNRFCHIVLDHGEPTLEEWVSYMGSKYNEHASSVIEFATQDTKHLDGDIKGEMGFSIQPSRRSWEWVTKIQKIYDKTKSTVSSEAYTTTLGGLIGIDLALSFTRYSCPVKPRDMLAQGVKPFAAALTKLSRIQLCGLMWGLVSYVKGKTNDEKIAVVCLDFAEHLLQNTRDNDLVVAFCRSLVTQKDESGKEDKSRAAVISNPTLAKLMAESNKKNGRARGFLDMLADRPQLQAALSKAAWGA